MPISLTMNATTEGEYYPQQLLSQKLNNRAAFLITIGNYVEGIALLTKTLKLVKNNMGDSSSRAHQSNCRSCSLQSCLIMEHDSLMMDQTQHYQEQEGQQQQEQQQEHQAHYIKNTSIIIISSSSDEMGCDDQPQRAAASQKHLSHHHNPHDTLDDNDNGFVYRRPILVNKQCIEEMHDMGNTLLLIIIFNLALAHHLKAIETSSSSSSSSSSTTMNSNNLKALQQALQLYELAYQLHCDYIQQSESESETSYNSNNNTNDQYDRSIGSLRFTMIVSNNLGEIHRAAGNTEKHTMCLHHLLSAIMYVVDSNLGVLDSNEMDGFYSNVSPVMGLGDKDMYAQAA